MIINPFILAAGSVSLIDTGFEFANGTTSFLDGGSLGVTWTIGAQGSIVSSKAYEGVHSVKQDGGNCATAPWSSGMDFGTSDFTIGVAAWIVDGSNGHDNYVLSAAETGAGGDAWAIRFGSGYPGNLQFVAHLASGTVTLTYASGLTGNTATWTDITVTRVGSALTLSLNGSSVASTTISGGFTARGGGHLVIGAKTAAGANPVLSCYFDKLRISKP